MTIKEATPSLRMYKPLRGYKFSRQDLKDLNVLLKELAKEAGNLEVSVYTKTIDQTLEEFEADKKLIKDLFDIHVQVEIATGAVLSQRGEAIFDRPDMPRAITGVEFDTAYIFRSSVNRGPRNRAYVLLDFRTITSPGVNVQPAHETPNNSQILVEGDNQNWVRSAYSKIDEFLEARRRKGIWIHKAGIYDIFLMTFGVLFIAWVMTWAVPFVDRLFAGYSQIYIYSGYAFSFLIALRFFMFMFDYSRLIWPLLEYKENSELLVRHRFVWSTILLGVIAGIIKDLL